MDTLPASVKHIMDTSLNTSITTTIKPKAIKTPKFQSKIHLPCVPGSFTFRKNGKYRLDQKVKKFCLLNNSIGCYELRVHLAHVNPSHIEYDANQKTIEINTFSDQKKYKLSICHPKGLKLHICENPEAQYHYGILSCKLPIIDYDRNIILKNEKRRGKQKKERMNKNSAQNMTENEIEIAQNKIDGKLKDNESNKKSLKKKKKRRMSKKEKSYERRINAKRSRKETMQMLNLKIMRNQQMPETLSSPVSKKRKLNKNEEFQVVDGVMHAIEGKIKEQNRKREEKVDEVKEFLKQRSQKKKEKEERLNYLRDEFMKRKKSGNQNGKYIWRQKGFKKAAKVGRKRVRFAV